MVTWLTEWLKISISLHLRVIWEKLLIPVKNLAYFDEKQMNWVVEPGMYNLMVGASSLDIKGSVVVKVK